MPSEGGPGADGQFAAQVLHNLLRRIEDQNHASGRDPFVVSYAWTEGTFLHLVYRVPRSDAIRGLTRDTGSYNGQDAALDYFVTDLKEGRVVASFPNPGEPDTILWHGSLREGLVDRLGDIPEAYRYEPPRSMYR